MSVLLDPGDPQGCLISRLQFVPLAGAPHRCGCRGSFSTFLACNSAKFGCISEQLTSFGAAVGHRCTKAWDGALRAEIPVEADDIPPRKISFAMALNMMETPLVGAPDRWWESLPEPLTAYSLCEHGRNILISKNDFDILRKTGHPRLKVYNPATGKYDIVPEKTVEPITTRRIAEGYCGNSACTGGHRGEHFKIVPQWAPTKKNRLRLKPSPRVDEGDCRRLCESCRRAVRKEMKDEEKEAEKKRKDVGKEKETETTSKKKKKRLSIEEARTITGSKVNLSLLTEDQLREKVSAATVVRSNDAKKNKDKRRRDEGRMTALQERRMQEYEVTVKEQTDLQAVADAAEHGAMVMKFKNLCAEAGQIDCITPLYGKLMSGKITLDAFIPTLLRSFCRNTDGAKCSWTEPDKKFFATLDMMESGRATLNFLGIHMPVPARSTLELFQAKNDNVGCGTEGFHTDAITAMIKGIDTLNLATSTSSSSTSSAATSSSPFPPGVMSCLGGSPCRGWLGAGCELVAEYTLAFSMPAWQDNTIPSRPILCLKFDETDLTEEIGEDEKFDRATGLFVVKFWGDELIVGIKDLKTNLQGEYTSMMQVPQSLLTGNGAQPSITDIWAWLIETWTWILTHEPACRAKFEELQAAKTAARTKLESSVSASNAIAMQKLHRDLVVLEINAYYAKDRLDKVHRASEDVTVLLSAPLLIATVRTKLSSIWLGVQAVFHCRRCPARKLLAFRAQDPIHGHRSEVAGLFLIRGISKEEIQKVVTKFKSQHDYIATSSDGGFSYMREQRSNNGVAHRPETASSLAKASLAKEGGPAGRVRATALAAAQATNDLHFAQACAAYQQEKKTPTRAQLSATDKLELKAEVLTQYVHAIKLDASFRRTPSAAICSRDDANVRYARAGTGHRNLAYPARLRLGEPEYPEPTSVGLKGVTMPFLLKKDLTDIFARLVEERFDTPISRHSSILEPGQDQLHRAEEELRAVRGANVAIDRAVLRRVAMMMAAVDSNNISLDDMEAEMQQVDYERAVSESRFTDFYADPIDTLHFDDIAHIEKNLVHGMQRDREALVGAIVVPEIAARAPDWDGGALPAMPARPILPPMAPAQADRSRRERRPTARGAEAAATLAAAAAAAAAVAAARPVPAVPVVRGARRSLLALDSAILLQVASMYSEFGPVKKVLLSLVDKQNVPAARMIVKNKLFHAALWKHGHKREAATLSVLNGAFDAFDCGKLVPSYRDYLCDRARHLIYLLRGPELDDVVMMAVSNGKGKKSCGIESGLLQRLLANIDQREQMIKKLNLYFNERVLGTDDLENFFSELCRRARTGVHSVTAQKALQVARTAERASRMLWDDTWDQYESKRKHYTKQQISSRNDWNSGARVPDWWPLEQHLVGDGKARAFKRMQKEGVKICKDRDAKVRNKVHHRSSG